MGLRIASPRRAAIMKGCSRRFDRGIVENGAEVFHAEKFESAAGMLHMRHLAHTDSAQDGTQQHYGVGLGSQHQNPVCRKF